MVPNIDRAHTYRILQQSHCRRSREELEKLIKNYNGTSRDTQRAKNTFSKWILSLELAHM